MSGLMFILAVLGMLVLFDILALTRGVDSRPDFEDPRAPAPGLYT